MYDNMLSRKIIMEEWSFNLSDFHKWLSGFEVNFKNYVRDSKFKCLLSCRDNEEMAMLVRIAFKHYLEE